MAAKSRRKGARIELEVLHQLQDAGIVTDKLSAMYKKTHDLQVVLFNHIMAMEIKSRANGFKTIYDWLEPVDLLALRADRKETLVVIPISTLIKLIKSVK
jgi:hypothetical protein